MSTPEELWRVWVAAIAADPEMDVKRTMKHLHKHMRNHIPDPDDSKERWEEWLAGAYNLLAILAAQKGVKPLHEQGVLLLYKKWLGAPGDHTPPPKEVKREVARPMAPRAGHGGGS